MTFPLIGPTTPGAPTRRQFLVGVLAASALVACGSDDDGSSAPEVDGSSGPDDGFPRTIDTALGDVEVAAAPRRVVALGNEGDAALALGVVPALVPGSAGDPGVPDRWLVDALDDREVDVIDLTSGSVPYEQLAAARPDLILAGTFFGIEEIYDDLTAIAPTVAFESGYYEDSWQDQTRLVARALGHDGEAERVIAGVELAVTEVADAHPEWQDKTFAFAFHYDAANIQVINTTDDPSARLFLELGLALAPGSQELSTQAGGVGASIGLEHVGALDADVLVMLYASDDLRASLEANPLFTGIPAVADGRYQVITFELAVALRNPTPLSIPFALDQIERQLADALAPT